MEGGMEGGMEGQPAAGSVAVDAESVVSTALLRAPLCCAQDDGAAAVAPDTIRPRVDQVVVDGAPGYTTYRLKLVMDPSTISTCYSIYGDHEAFMTFPPAYQVRIFPARQINSSPPSAVKTLLTALLACARAGAVPEGRRQAAPGQAVRPVVHVVYARVGLLARRRLLRLPT